MFGDEHHRKTKLGRATKYEVRIRRDASGKIAPPEKDGVLKAKNKRATQKSNKEARGMFMAAEVKVPAGGADDEAGSGGEGSDGEEDQAWAYDGRRLPPLNYSGAWVVGVKSWNEELEKERVKAKAMKRKFGGVGLGYEDQPGAMQLDAWGEPMWKRDAGQWLNRRSEDAKVCVTDLIDHMITESKKIYAGTDMEDRFLMFHDALAQWNEDEAQLYIKTRYPGFKNRFIKPVCTTCAGTIYHNMVPGNSPENARGLDSFGFADLEYAMCFNCALAWHYPYGDARRIFGQGTPKEVWHLMEQTWTVVGVPTNARITEDISGWERVFDKIIEAKGTIVPDENFRTGRRARKMHGEGERKTKLHKRDRKTTHLLDLPVHPALMEAYEDLLGPEGGGAAAEGP